MKELKEPKLYIMTANRVSGIYTITNKVTGKLYLGESLDIYRRWHDEHIPQLRKNCHYNKELQKDFNEYGEENFNFEILERYSEDNPITTKARILILEGYFITQFKKSGVDLYNAENTLAEILSGNKVLLQSDTLFNVILSTLNNYRIKICDGFAYFEKRKTIESILFEYIVPKKGETKTLILKEFEKYLEDTGNQKRFFVSKHFVHFVKNSKKSNIEIEEIREDKIKDIEKAVILFSEYRTEKKNILTVKDDSGEMYAPITDEEVRFSNLFKMFSEDGTLPKDYSYYKIREYLAKLNIIEIKEMECNGATTRITFATDNAINKKILRIVKRKKHGDSYSYSYVFTRGGIEYMRDIFSNLSENEKVELFVNKEVA